MSDTPTTLVNILESAMKRGASFNDVIREISAATPGIDGNADEWLERPYELMGEMWNEFLCGSCRGIYRSQGREFQILAVQNTKKNNNFDRVLEWFEKSCVRDGYALSFLEVENPRLEEKLRLIGFKGNSTKMTRNYTRSTTNERKPQNDVGDTSPSPSKGKESQEHEN